MGNIDIYCGNGRGKTTLAIGKGIQASTQEKSVIIIQFLKGKERKELDFLENMETRDIKVFRFEKMDACYEDLTQEEKEEENINILNGVNFARKVVVTQECDFLILDEVLGLLDTGIISIDVLTEILKQRNDSMDIIMTGRECPEELKEFADTITELTTIYTREP
ncbi:MAG: cob(I)yrinic acid a,c-diamide adenosyltransferase [Blautia sp.]|nr:cob(I)yrinic acid a,c-diamide adenosyltransferase [Blautia sp.]